MSRAVGTPNRFTKEIKEKILSGIDLHINLLSNYIESIESPKDKVDAIAKLLPYLIPKLREIDVTSEQKQMPENIKITIV
jgi:hypothetical protein